ncbi:MAG: DNA (cytosine-5-)-methyltransferase [Gemmatimonas sp.]|nr:DNA (cytosine-5-)-methyltransferase [Gemmatimonas sp.]
MPKHQATAFDCFAGCGGMTEGFKQAGYNVIGAVEIDARAADVYTLNHPSVQVWREDISQVTAESILHALNLAKGELDLLGGCPPCQGFSRLRTKNGRRRVRDERNDLIFEFQRLVLELWPRHVMLENVPRLISDRRHRLFTQALKNAGYVIKARVLNVAQYGVPQRRRRAVVIASRVSEPRLADEVCRLVTVREAIGLLGPAGRSGDALHDLPEHRSVRVRERIRNIPKDGGGRSSLPAHLTLKCHGESDGFGDVYGRMAWDEVAPTITTGCFNPSKGRFLHPSENRAITLREAALLQSFPLTYKFPANIGKVKLAEMIGNALPPAFIRAHSLALRERRRHG